MSTYTLNGVNYAYTGGQSTARVASSNPTTGNITLQSSFIVNGATYTVNRIVYRAFYNCTGLIRVIIPNTITTIEEGAFEGCTGLISVIIPNSVTSIGILAFVNCSALTTITIPNSVTTIGGFTFQGCTGLTNITIPNSATTIQNGLCRGCSGLTSITIPNSVTSIGDYAFLDCSGLTSITIPNLVTTIGASAFQGCTGLTNITIPNLVTTIGASAFQGCTGLTNITIPNSVTNIGGLAFDRCSSLTTFTFPNSLTTINNSLFNNCTSLKTVFISASVINIINVSNLFIGCTALTDILVDSDNSVYFSQNGVLFNKNNTTLTNFSVPAKTIGDAAFTLTAPTSNSSGLITYTSSNEAVATIVGDVVSIVGAGTSTITALQQKTSIYKNGTVAATLTVSKAAPTITNFVIPVKKVGDVSFIITPPTTNSTGVLSYTSSNTAVATINSTTGAISLYGAGTSMITATQAPTTNFLSASITVPFQLNLTNATIAPTISSFSLPTKAVGDAAFVISAPTSNSTGAFTYTSSNTTVATINSTTRTITIFGAGNTTISATQESSTTYLSGNISATLTVNPLPTLTNFSVPAKRFGDTSFIIVSPTSNSMGTFTYTSSNTAVATVSGNTVTIVKNGSSTITATQASTADYGSRTISAILTVSQATPTLTNFIVPTKKIGDWGFNVSPPTSNSTGAFTYTSSNIMVASITTTGAISLYGAGTSMITATQAPTTNFLSASITVPFQLNLTNATIAPTISSFSLPTKAVGDAAFVISAPTSNSTGAFTYTSSNTTVATINSTTRTITIVGAGNTTISAIQTSSATYLSGNISATLTVNPLPTITNFSVPVNTRDVSFNIVSPTSNSNGLITYTSSNNAVATIDNTTGTITIVEVGSSTITATQASTADYGPGTISTILTVSKETTVLTNFSVPEKTFGDANFTITNPTTNSDGAFTYISFNTAVATISGTTVTIVGPGSSTIIAKQASTANYTYAITCATLTVNKITTNLSNFSVPAKTFGNADFTLSAPTSNSTGAFTYTSSNPAVATVSGTTVKIFGIGSSTITATQTSTANFLSAIITATLTVSKAIPTITSFSVPTKTCGDIFSINQPTSNSPGAYTYTSSNPAVATIDGDVITNVGVGSSIITATQASTTNYESGTITATMIVTQGTTVLTNFSVPAKTAEDVAFTILPPASNSDGELSYTSSNLAVATVSGSTITIVGVGSSTITATQSNTTNYGPATTTSTLTVSKATPTITSFVIPVKKVGDAIFTVSQPSSNSPGTFTYTSSNTAVATINSTTGAITIVASGVSNITATQDTTTNFLSASITVPFRVNRAAATTAASIGSLSVPVKVINDAPFVISAPTSNNSGTFTYTSSNPAVATINSTTRTITIVGAGNTTISATQESNTIYLSGTITTTFQVNPLPTLTNFSLPVKTVGDASFNIVSPITNSNGAFTYTSPHPGVATIIGSRMTIVGSSGSSFTITATQASSATYGPGTITANFTINKLNPTISNLSLRPTKVGDPSFIVTAPTSNNDSAFTYTSSNPAVATINSATRTITIISAGFTSIIANQQSSYHLLSGSTVAPLAVSADTASISPTITNFFVPIGKKVGHEPFALNPPISDSTGDFIYTSSNPSVATIAGTTVTIVGSGSTIIFATQTSIGAYLSGTITAIMTVNPDQSTTVLTNFSIPTKTFGDASFTVSPPTSNSNGPFTYTSSNTAVATIIGSTITIVGIGTSSITANQASNGIYTSARINAIMTVNPITTVLTNFSVPSKTIGGDNFTITPPTSNRTGSITYTSSNMAVAIIDGTTVTIVGLGTSTITATQASNGIYGSATTTATFSVNKITTNLSNFSVPAKTFGNAAFSLVAPTTNSTGVLSYTSSNTAVATISGTTVTIVGAGTSTISAIQASTTTYETATITSTLTVSQATPTITNFSNITKTTSDANFLVVAPTSTSPGAFTYTSSNTEVATIHSTNRTITINKIAGTSTITVNQASTANYISATITATLTVNKGNPTFSFAGFSTKTIVDAPFIFTPATTNSDGVLTYTSSNTSVATIDGNVITIVGIGTSSITASVSNTANFNSTSATNTLTVTLIPPILTDFYIFTKNFGDANFTITDPTSTSPGEFTYTSSNTAVATINSTTRTITIIGVGTSTITASQAINGNYGPATITATLTVNKGAPIITNFSIPVKKVGDAGFTVSPPTSNSSGSFTYTSSATGVATINSTTRAITINAAGTSIITATQGPSGNYYSGTIQAAFQVNLATATIAPTITSLSVPVKSHGDFPFVISAPTSNSTGAFTYTSSNMAVATIDNATRTITIFSPGTITITATQASIGTYLSGTTTATLQVNPIPTLTNFSIPVKTIGDASFNIVSPTSNSDGLITYTSSNTAVATISGNTITIIGVGTTNIAANQARTSNYGPGQANATLTVNLRTTGLTNFSIPIKTVGDASFNIPPPTSNSSGAFTYTSSNTAVAIISGSSILIVGGGTSTITATQAAITNFASGTIMTTLQVKPLSTLTNFSVPAKTIGDANFTVSPPTSNSTGAFTYTSSNTSVAIIAGNSIMIIGVGTSTITATQASIENYGSGTTTATLTVSIGTTVLTNFSIPIKAVGDASFIIPPPTSNSSGAFTYTSSNTAVATISGSTVSIVGGGTSTITATQAATTNFASGTIMTTLQVNLVTTTVLSNFSAMTKTFGDAAFSLVAPTTNGNGAFTYTSSNPAVATVSGTTITIVGGGTSTITANQASTLNFSSASTTATLTVSQATTALSGFSAITKSFGAAAFSLVAPTSTSTGAFTYTSSNTSVATISGTTVSIVGVGTSTITATQASTANYLSASTTATMTVSKGTLTLTGFSVQSKIIGSAPFTITPPTTVSTGAFTYTSSNTAVATIAGDLITVVGFGSSTITATQATTANYLAATTTAVFQVTKTLPTLSNFSIPTQMLGSPSFAISPPTSNSDGAFTYTSSDLSIATIFNGNMMVLKGGGSAIITATQTSSANFGSASITTTLLVNSVSTSLTNFNVSAKTFGDAAFRIQASSNSSGAINYTSSDTSVATIVGNMVTIVGGGTATLTASQESWNIYGSATISALLTVNPATPILANFTAPLKIVGNESFALPRPFTNGNGLFTYTSSNTAVATIVDNIATIVGAGSSTITATHVGTPNYATATISSTLQVNQGIPTITNFSVPAKTIGDTSFAITPPTTNSDGLITYRSSNVLIATIAENVVSIVGTGTATITATQASTANYTSATITAPFVVSKRLPALSNFSVPAKTFGEAAFTISPPTTNGIGNFTYTSSNTDVATINRNVITIVGIGSSTISAIQASTANFASETITATLQVNQGISTLTNFSVPAKTIGDAAFTLTAPTSNSSGLITYTSSNEAVATIVGDVVSIVGVGTSTITANQESTANYPSGTINATFLVNRMTPVLTNFSVSSSLFGDPDITIVPPTSTSSGSFTYTSSNPEVATIVGGVLSIVGTGSSTITATQEISNNYGSASTTAVFSVIPPKAYLTDFSIPVQIIGDPDFAITPPTGNSTGAFTYMSSKPTVATVSGDIITIVGLGNTVITATQESTANFTSATITTIFQVKLIRTVLTNFSVPTKALGDAAFTITPPTTNSDGEFSYRSSNNLVATISGNVITIVGSGSATITAFQESTFNSTAGITTAPFVINKATPVITNFVIPERTIGTTTSFRIPPPSTNGAGTITYTSSNPEVVTIVRDVVTIVGSGSAIITATQSGSANFVAGSTSTTFTVNPATPVLTNFSIPVKTFGDADLTIAPPNSNSTGLFTYTSSDTEVATIAGDIITIVGAGTTTITATQANAGIYTSGTITALFRVNRIVPVLDNFSIPEKTFEDTDFTLTPPTSIGIGAFTYTSSNPAVATIVGDVVSIAGAGNSTITVVQEGSRNYASRTTTALLRVYLLSPTLSSFSVPAKTFGNETFSLVPPTSNSDGAFTYTSSNPRVATIAGDVVTMIGVGTTMITANQASSANYRSGTITALFVVSIGSPAITNFTIPVRAIGTPDFTIPAPTSNSPGIFTYTSANPAIATVNGNRISIKALGSSLITATQASTANFTSGTISTTFVVDKISPIISNFIIPSKSLGENPFKITRPTSNSTTAFTYTSSNLSVATIVGDIITVIGAGTSTITATQPGSTSLSAGIATTVFEVIGGEVEITDFAIPVKALGNAPFTITPPISNSLGAFTYTSSNTAVATVEGDVITIVGLGTSTITAVQASTQNYSSGIITADLFVNNPIPQIGELVIRNSSLTNRTITVVNPTQPIDNNGTWTYVSSNSLLASVNQNVITLLKIGIVTITATLSANSFYNSEMIIVPFSITALKAKPGIFVFITSTIVRNAIPANIEPVGSRVLIPSNIFTPTIISTFNPTAGKPAEKEVNHTTIINTLFYMFPTAKTIILPSEAIYIPKSVKKNILTSMRIIRPNGTTVGNPFIINTTVADVSTVFLCSMIAIGNGVRINGSGAKNAGFYIQITRGINNKYQVIRNNRQNKPITSIVSPGIVIVYGGITATIGYGNLIF